MTVRIGELTSRVDVLAEPGASGSATPGAGDAGQAPPREASVASVRYASRTRAEGYDD